MTKAKKKKICVVTGSRAEYGLLRWLLKGFQESEYITLQLIVTGMHLSAEYGKTISEIEIDGFSPDRKVEMLLSSDTSVGVTKSMGLGIIGFADSYCELEPDMVLILGDRFEAFSAASAALIANIPICHLHGGEVTEGSYDEKIRHSITKMSNIHFVATEEYSKRVIQMGEDPKYVYNVGGLGLDNISNLNLLSKQELEQELSFKFLKRNLLVTYHPETSNNKDPYLQFNKILEALSYFKDTGIIFTLPNADTGRNSISSLVKEFCNSKSNYTYFNSLGSIRYLSCLKYLDAVIGNSSSGIIEAPSFNIPTVNIGNRQKGRIFAKSIINCPLDVNEIQLSIELACSEKYKISISNTKNPYGDGGASKKIIKTIESLNFADLGIKLFHDLE